MKKIKNLFTFIFVISLLALFGILISFKKYYSNLNQELTMQVESDLTDSSNILNQHISSKIQNIFTVLENIAATLTYSSMDVNNENFKQMLQHQSNSNNLGVLSVYVKDILEALLSDHSISDSEKEQIQKLLNGDNIIGFRHSGNSEDNCILVVVPIMRNSAVIGILQCRYTTDAFCDKLELTSFDGHGRVNIMDADGTSITAPASKRYFNCFDMISKSTLLDNYTIGKFKQDIKDRNSGILHYIFREEDYSQYTPLSINDWYLYNVVPASYIKERTNYISEMASALITRIMIILIILIIIILISQYINTYHLRQNRNKLLMEQQRYNKVLTHSKGVIWEYDIARDTLVKSNKEIGIYSGLSVLNNLYDTIIRTDSVHPHDILLFEKFYNDMRSGKKEMSVELRAKDISGKYVWFELSGLTVYNNNVPITVIGKSMNIDKQKKELEQLKDAAHKDSLTKLYNRSYITELVNARLRGLEPNRTHAFCVVDIDNFKSINATLGHAFGDALLIELSSRFKRLTGDDRNIAARIGGDEFVIFFCDVPSLSFIEEKAKEICGMFYDVYIGEATNLSVTGSIGISLAPEHGQDFHTLLEKADTALYYSKQSGKDGYCIYNDNLSVIRESLQNPEEHMIESSYQHIESSLIDSDLISNVVDILFDARELEVSINMSLALIGNFYNLDRLVIFEYSEDNQHLICSYEWISDMEKPNYKYSTEQVPMNIADEYAFYKNNIDVTYFCDDTDTLTEVSPLVTDMLREKDIKSLFQCAIADKGILKGYIAANIFHKPKKWIQNELDSLTLLSKIIGGHIIKLRSQERAERIASRDLLTGIFNLSRFTKEAANILAENPDEKYILIYTDIDKFKFINEKYGYSVGDKVLIAFADILNSLAQPNEIFARVNADKFVGLCHYTGTEDFINRMIAYNDKFNHIPKTDTDYFKLSVITGLCPADPSENISIIIDRANIARKSIKERHRSNYAFFNESMKSILVKQKEIEDIMVDALLNEEFVVYYQPKFSLDSEIICGAEALIRWQHPEAGLISPSEFVPIFEENGFIIEIDFYVFRKVCSTIRDLLAEGRKVFPISVNFSRSHVNTPNWIQRLQTTIEEFNIPKNYIEIEITESALVDNDAYLLSMLYKIHNLGFKLSMDDFGSGLSSLNSLRKMPFDILKIDKDFFQQGSDTDRERIVIKNIVTMANELDMEIISEGVETQEQVNFLKEINCTIAQGYYFSKPISSESFIEKYF